MSPSRVVVSLLMAIALASPIFGQEDQTREPDNASPPPTTAPDRTETAPLPPMQLTGNIRGTVLDPETNEGLIGAVVRVDGTSLGAFTDVNGDFLIPRVPVGAYTVRVQMLSYQERVFQNVRVEANQAAAINTTLQLDAIEVEGAQIVATINTATDVSLITEIREAQQVVSGISSDQIGRSQDRDAAMVLRRIPGVTIVENRFVNIRGLSERYNLVMLNGALTPSSENDQKAFSFDLVPSNMIDRMLIYKSGAPELPGEFAGGVVKIFTKAPLDNNISFTYAAGYRLGTHSENFLMPSERGSLDFIGFGGENRQLPANFPQNVSQLVNQPGYPQSLVDASRSLPNTWGVEARRPFRDERFSLSITRVVNRNTYRWGNVTSVNYSNAFQQYDAERSTYNLQTNGSGQDRIYLFNDDQNDHNVRFGILHNWFAVLGNGRHRLEFRNFFNQLGSSQTTLRTGANIEAGSEVQGRGLRYESRSIYMGQLFGQHIIGSELNKLEWTLGYSYANRQEPDFRRGNARRPIGSADSVPFQITVPPGASNTDASRFFSKALEHLFMVNAEFERRLRNPDSTEVVPTLRAGIYAEQKFREFDARWMAFAYHNAFTGDQDLVFQSFDQVFSSQNINSTTGFVLQEGTNPTDNYTATNQYYAGYLGATLPFLRKFQFTGGLRFEYNNQELRTEVRSGQGGTPVRVKLELPILLPSANLSYNITPRMLVRSAYFRSLNRPEFRELAPFVYYDFKFNNVIQGNPNLQNPTIHNVDVRWEFYPSNGEMIQFGFFYKYFDKPIEMFFEPGAGGSLGTRQFAFNNAEWSVSRGLEVEIRKSIGRITGPMPILRDLFVVFNASVIQSRVKLGDQALQQDQERPLMGQSPYVVNAGLYYDNPDIGLQVSGMYNLYGARIFAVGANGLPNVFDMPRNLLDFTLKKRLNSWLQMQAGVSDLFNDQFQLLQDGNRNGLDMNDEFILRYRPGQYFTLGLSLNLN